MSKLNEILRHLRLKKGVTQKDIAEYLGISIAAYSLYERGMREPRLDDIEKLSEYFGVSIDYLITGEHTSINTDDSLSPRDKSDIAKDLDRIMGEIKSRQDGPLYYNGTEIDKASVSLLEHAIEYALTQAKKENKVKYNPNKQEKAVEQVELLTKIPEYRKDEEPILQAAHEDNPTPEQKAAADRIMEDDSEWE